jgi:hypothetical protein
MFMEKIISHESKEMGNSEERKGSFSNCNPGTAMG